MQAPVTTTGTTKSEHTATRRHSFGEAHRPVGTSFAGIARQTGMSKANGKHPSTCPADGGLHNGLCSLEGCWRTPSRPHPSLASFCKSRHCGGRRTVDCEPYVAYIHLKRKTFHRYQKRSSRMTFAGFAQWKIAAVYVEVTSCATTSSQNNA